jgi:drug/metabolite transporter (DMT)-like permease
MGLIFILGKVALAKLSPEFFVAWNFILAAGPLGIWTVASGRWKDLFQCSLRGWIYIIGFSVFSMVALQCLWSAIKHLDPTVGAFISRLQVLVAVLLGVMFLRERFGRWEIIGGLVLIVGLIVIRISFDVTLGYWFWVMVIGAILFGTSEVFAKSAVSNMHPIPLNFIRATITAISFLAVVLVQGRPLFEFQGMFWYVLGVGVGGSIFARLMFLYALKYIEVSKSMLVRQMQPIFVFILAFSTLGLLPTARELIGGALILAGCVVMIGGRRG